MRSGPPLARSSESRYTAVSSQWLVSPSPSRRFRPHAVPHSAHPALPRQRRIRCGAPEVGRRSGARPGRLLSPAGQRRRLDPPRRGGVAVRRRCATGRRATRRPHAPRRRPPPGLPYPARAGLRSAPGRADCGPRNRRGLRAGRRVAGDRVHALLVRPSLRRVARGRRGRGGSPGSGCPLRGRLRERERADGGGDPDRHRQRSRGRVG